MQKIIFYFFLPLGASKNGAGISNINQENTNGKASAFLSYNLEVTS